jgi:hypothetical protein
VGEIKMYTILFERTVGQLSPARITGRWVGTVKIDYQRIDLCCVKWIELEEDQI